MGWRESRWIFTAVSKKQELARIQNNNWVGRIKLLQHYKAVRLQDSCEKQPVKARVNEEGRKYKKPAAKQLSLWCKIIASMPSLACHPLPEIVVIHSFNNVFTSLNSTAPARLGACGLNEPGCSVCRADGPEQSEVDGTASGCCKHRIW